MERIISIIIAAMSMAMIHSSCDRDSKEEFCGTSSRQCSFSVALNFIAGMQLKSMEGYTSPQDNELKVNSVQIFVFGSSGKLEACHNAGTGIHDIIVTTTPGEKTIWAIVNGPDLSSASEISDMNGLCNKGIDLSDNGTATGFVMAGSKDLTISPSTVSVSIPVRRLVSRIALQKITSNLPSIYGPITIENVFLANVAGNQNLAGSSSPSAWYNRMGRTDSAQESSMIINGASCPASCPDLTFRRISCDLQYGDSHIPDIPYLLYCYPNGSSSDDTGWSIPFTERKTRIVITALIAGTAYYYPVTLEHPERNKAYTIGVTISGLGSTDPDIPVTREEASICIEIQDWENGACYEETI